jgi:protein involved in polysaccharide export with SLBB domain
MRKFHFFILLTFSFLTVSQEISQAYLDSLPKEIRDDVLLRIDKKNDLEKEVYRSINSSSDVKKEISEDKIFGSDFFDTMQSSFMPINVPNLDDSYTLDFGDILKIQLIGQNDSIDSYQLARDGSINIPDIGKIFLSGLSLKNASEMIVAKIKQTYIGVEAYISLENIRDVSILVSGNAYNPGIYTLNGSSNMLHALHAAGGISQFGSYRNIKLIRDGQIIDTLDIYQILLKGDFGPITRLRSGDMIFIDKRSNVVEIEGAFKRTGFYELLENQNLSDAIFYANGVSIDADFSNIFLYRLLDGEFKDIPITNISQFENIESRDLDRIFIRVHSFRNVEISGAVLRPGNYKMIEGDNIFDLIERSGGYTQNAFPQGAIYQNKDAELINKLASEKLYNTFIDALLEIIQQGSGETDITSIVTIANELKNTEPNGRVIVDLLDDTTINLVMNNDVIRIPEKNNNVFIFGEVLSEGSLIYQKDANLEFYLKEASGLKDSADSESIFILYPNGRTKQFSRKRNLFASQSQNIKIEAGSVIFVPRAFDNSLSSRLTTQAYASILGNIGVTLASISAINNN